MFGFCYLDLALPATLASCADILARLGRHDRFLVLSRPLACTISNQIKAQADVVSHLIVRRQQDRLPEAELRGGGAIPPTSM